MRFLLTPQAKGIGPFTIPLMFVRHACNEEETGRRVHHVVESGLVQALVAAFSSYEILGVEPCRHLGPTEEHSARPNQAVSPVARIAI